MVFNVLGLGRTRLGMGRLVSLHFPAGAFKELAPRHHDVTPGITLVRRSVFTFGHQFETTALNTICAARFLRGPKRWGGGSESSLSRVPIR
jgi:hypothetical protein